MRIFISGGCKNGKSYYAQHLAKQQCRRGPLYYIATMNPVDAEDNERIAKHRREREGWGFTTIEQPFDIEKILLKCDCGGSFMLDSLTALLANEMFPPGSSINEDATCKISAALYGILEQIRDIVIISDYIYSDACIYDPLTAKYRKSLAQIDRITAGNSDLVLEMAYTNVIVHKGKYEKIP